MPPVRPSHTPGPHDPFMQKAEEGQKESHRVALHHPLRQAPISATTPLTHLEPTRVELRGWDGAQEHIRGLDVAVRHTHAVHVGHATRDCGAERHVVVLIAYVSVGHAREPGTDWGD